MDDAQTPDHAANLRQLQATLPPDYEIGRLLRKLQRPIDDEASADRYAVLVAAAAVEQALHLATEAVDPGRGNRNRPSFHNLIDMAAARNLVSPKERAELEKIREIRNLFAHALGPISFAVPEVHAACKSLYDHPVDDWASYFAPVFPPRHKFVIVCGAFFRSLMRKAGTPMDVEDDDEMAMG